MNEMQPNSTLEKTAAPVKPYKEVEFDAYISYMALGGLTTTDDGKVSKMPLEEFCAQLGIDRSTTFYWKKNTPNFYDLVHQRRAELMPLGRASAVWNQLYLLALQTSDKRAAVDAAKTWLGHYEKLRLPSQEVTHEVGENFADLVSAHRQNQRTKVIDVTPDE